MSELRTVTRKFDTIEQAREDARKFADAGWKIESGQEVEGGFEWSGKIRCGDTCKEIRGQFHCGRCARTGQFITGTVNGKPTGPGGECFRCQGKGHHTQVDRKRNYWYDIQMFTRN